MTAPAGDRLIGVGLVVALLGMAATLVALVPLASDVELPSALWALSMLSGVGFGLVLVGLVRKGRRRARRQVNAPSNSG